MTKNNTRCGFRGGRGGRGGSGGRGASRGGKQGGRGGGFGGNRLGTGAFPSASAAADLLDADDPFGQDTLLQQIFDVSNLGAAVVSRSNDPPVQPKPKPSASRTSSNRKPKKNLNGRAFMNGSWAYSLDYSSVNQGARKKRNVNLNADSGATTGAEEERPNFVPKNVPSDPLAARKPPAPRPERESRANQSFRSNLHTGLGAGARARAGRLDERGPPPLFVKARGEWKDGAYRLLPGQDPIAGLEHLIAGPVVPEPLPDNYHGEPGETEPMFEPTPADTNISIDDLFASVSMPGPPLPTAVPTSFIPPAPSAFPTVASHSFTMVPPLGPIVPPLGPLERPPQPAPKAPTPPTFDVDMTPADTAMPMQEADNPAAEDAGDQTEDAPLFVIDTGGSGEDHNENAKDFPSPPGVDAILSAPRAPAPAAANQRAQEVDASLAQDRLRVFEEPIGGKNFFNQAAAAAPDPSALPTPPLKMNRNPSARSSQQFKSQEPAPTASADMMEIEPEMDMEHLVGGDEVDMGEAALVNPITRGGRSKGRKRQDALRAAQQKQEANLLALVRSMDVDSSVDNSGIDAGDELTTAEAMSRIGSQAPSPGDQSEDVSYMLTFLKGMQPGGHAATQASLGLEDVVPRHTLAPSSDSQTESDDEASDDSDSELDDSDEEFDLSDEEDDGTIPAPFAKAAPEFDSDDDSTDDSDEDPVTRGMFRGCNAWLDGGARDPSETAQETEEARFRNIVNGDLDSGRKKNKKGKGRQADPEILDHDDDQDETMRSDFDLTAAFDAATFDEGDMFLPSEGDDPDEWLEGLQAQWVADKERKAAKKQRRAAQVHAPGLTSSLAHGVKGLNKKQRKRLAKQQRRTAMYADVLDAADADVIPSIDGLPEGLTLHAQLLKANETLASFHATVGKNRGGKGKKKPERNASGRFSFGQVGDDASLLADQLSAEAEQQTQGSQSYNFPPMHKAVRALLHQLARAYGMSSKSFGKGEARFSAVSLPDSALGANPKAPRVDVRSVTRILDSAVRADRKSAAGLKGILETNGAGRGGLKGAASAPRNKDGMEVGWGADKIGSENTGYRLLAMMGWQHGAGLGAQEGISEPIAATVKVTKGGLGF